MPSFNTAFAAARKAGKKTFTWNGNRYNTTLATGSKMPKNVPVPGKRPADVAKTTTGKTATASKARAEYPKPMRSVGFATAGSGLSKIVARSENKPREAEKKPVQGPTPDGVWYARKGSPMSIAAARRANRAVPNVNAATAYALGLMKK
jgi:hypothetical protein